MNKTASFQALKCPRCDGYLKYEYSHKSKVSYHRCEHRSDCDYYVAHSPDGDVGSVERIPCFSCGGELMQKWSRQNNEFFWGCINYPYCDESMNNDTAEYYLNGDDYDDSN